MRSSKRSIAIISVMIISAAIAFYLGCERENISPTETAGISKEEHKIIREGNVVECTCYGKDEFVDCLNTELENENDILVI